ncbi:MAG: thiamine phosphate synthase [Chloroherpetonaceae bacterium]|nr:thiamine phosphate synthase [Chloroherpetonaceae bacterium]MDW8438500.1 thiamine phosphate synthase [Chloroherpetonaceae bacterium]
MKKPIGKLCVITDVVIQSRYSHLELCELAIRGGASVVQLRDKSASTRDLYALAVAMQLVCRKFGATFIVNDRVDVALAADADGVHLGQTDLPIPVARKILGDKKIIGGSASTLEEALQVERDGADYVGFGHVFSTTTKLKASAPKGVEGLKDVLAAVKIPVMAIGGINASNVAQVARAGAPSVAVISAVCAAADPTAAARELLQSMSETAID